MINDKDKEEFEKWFKDFYEVDFNAGTARFMGQFISWKYACDYIRNRSPLDPVSLYDKLERERERSEMLFEAVKKCNDDHWFMINLIERYSSDKEQALKDCLERMKFRKPFYEKTLEKYRGEK
ncbi:hypothetical protein EBQ81_01465 [bacterium]|nr:hypothetical protein [bacterium]